MGEMNQVTFAETKYTEKQLGRLESFINKEKAKAGGTFLSIPFKGIDKNGKSFEYINESFKQENIEET